ncbi:hypothetical protein DXG03_004496 [Asterophora parasitica]|uniref:Uncharacterized protein n=1 Tax=Asterophora parasitica TaxID=117018 RepID=A0A9P7G9P4_9AGAR|nr:hypothetical protein DXG03_004496 [Asterophora parasitica]
MRRHSNPSSFSSTTPPSAEEEAVSPARATSPTVLRDHSETQRSLQQASAALDAAYRRIRQVRRNLLEVTGNINLPNRSFDTTGLAPDLNAIDPGPRSPYLGHLEHLTESPTMPLPEPPRPRRLLDLPPLITASLINPTPPIPDRPIPLPRRSQLEHQFPRRRDDYMDDASTSLGRRVAAREATIASNSGYGSSATLNSLSHFDGNSAQLLASIERDIDHFRTMARLRRADASTAAPGSATAPALPRPALGVIHPSSYNSPIIRESIGTSNRLLGVMPSPRIRRRLPMNSSRLSGSTESERPSLLSNFSVQNLPTPVSAGIARPLLFDEPATYLPAANFTEPDTRQNVMEDSLEEHRNYTIRRRYNVDGEEHVHPINFEWNDENPTWIGPGGVLTENERRRESSQAVQGSSRRRRGWARLDADGNEIPSDEEEEFERVRAEYRVQALTRPHSHDRTLEAQSHPGFHSLQAATTSASLSPDEGSIPRVRLNVREPRPVAKKTVTSIKTKRNLETTDVSSFVFCHPLPMPLEEMVWSPPTRKAPSVVMAPKHASLAGR